MFEDMRGAMEYDSDEWNIPEPSFTLKEVFLMDIAHLLEGFL